MQKTSDVIDKQHLNEIAAYEELKQRLAIAEKVIEDKNKQSRK